MSEPKPLRLLIAEDQQSDADLVMFELKRHGYAPLMERVQTAEDMRTALTDRQWDLIISDYSMPRFNALQALKVAQEFETLELPFIIVSGSVGEETAVEALTSGAHDFVSKENLARLVPSIERSLANARLRRERRELISALQMSVKARDEFLAIAAHELRTPLTSLKLHAQSLARLVAQLPLTETPVPARLQSVLVKVKHLEDLINRLLDISRITSGRLQLDIESEVDLAELVRDVAQSFSEELQRSGSTLAIEAPTPVVGLWDRLRMHLVVSNLTANAIKYGNGQPIRIVVSQKNQTAELMVEDRGIGILPEDQARIFERFERAVPVRHYGGFGVGLWLVRQIVEAHHGHIQVRSEPNEGSVFTVELPLETPVDAATSTP